MDKGVKLTRKFLFEKGVNSIDTNDLAHRYIISNKIDLDIMAGLDPQVKEIEDWIIDQNMEDNLWTKVEGRYFSTDEIRRVLGVDFKWIKRDF